MHTFGDSTLMSMQKQRSLWTGNPFAGEWAINKLVCQMNRGPASCSSKAGYLLNVFCQRQQRTQVTYPGSGWLCSQRLFLFCASNRGLYLDGLHEPETATLNYARLVKRRPRSSPLRSRYVSLQVSSLPKPLSKAKKQRE